jgi:hypothetical protein
MTTDTRKSAKASVHTEKISIRFQISTRYTKGKLHKEYHQTAKQRDPRKINKRKVFATDDSALKVIYLAIKESFKNQLLY